MIELYIDGSLVALPDNFTSKIIEENPVYTKNSKYTYDIELSLKNPVNAKIYKHLSRFNNSFPMTTNRTAILVVDNSVEVSGTEVILAVDRNSVKIQLVSGNSELNFLVGGEKKVRDLDMGAVIYPFIPVYGPDVIYPGDLLTGEGNHYFEYLSMGYPTKNFIIAPFYSNDQARLFNGYGLNRLDTDTGTTIPKFWRNGNRARPQPYLAAILDKLIYALSYTLVENAIGEHSIFKLYYIVHGYYTLEYAKMLPDWTVNDFLSKIEKQFNCTFIVNENNKTVKLLFNGTHELSEPNYIDVFDDHLFEIDAENNIDLSIANIEYDLENNDINKYAKLDQNIYDYAVKDTYTSLFDLASKVTLDANKFKKIYEGFYGDFIVIPVGASGFDVKKVNQFKNLYQNTSESIDETFDIIPVPMIALTEAVRQDPSDAWVFYNQYPVVYNTELAPAADTDDFVLSEILEDRAVLPKTNLNSKMQLAMYNGLQTLDWVTTSPEFAVAGYPTPFVEALAAYFSVASSIRTFFFVDSFHLKWLADNIYSRSKVNTTKKYRIRFYKKDNLSIVAPFIANNKKFVCISYEKTIQRNGFSKLFEGDFYPIEG